MRINSRLIFLMALALVVTVGVAFGSAADLRVQGGTIQSGTVHVLTFDEDGVMTAEWELDTVVGGVSSVYISGFEEVNYGNMLTVVLTGIDHQEIAHGEGKVDATNMSVNFDQAVAAFDIYDIHVYLEGFQIVP